MRETIEKTGDLGADAVFDGGDVKGQAPSGEKFVPQAGLS